MHAGVLGTWPVTVEIEEEGGQWMEEGRKDRGDFRSKGQFKRGGESKTP